MPAALTAAGVAVVLGELALIVACWKSRTALAGVLGAVGVALVVFAVAHGSHGQAAEYSIAVAAVTLVIGTTLYILGQVLERLLEGEPDDAPGEGPRGASRGADG